MHSMTKGPAKAMSAGQLFGDAYRTLTDKELIETLLLEGFAYDADSDAARAEARDALDCWLASGLASRRSDRGALFDPVEVMYHATICGVSGEDDFWDRCFVSTLRRFVTDLEQERPTSIQMTYHRRFDMSRTPAGSTRRLRMPLPLTQRYARLEIRPELPEQASTHRLSDGRLEARVTATEAPEITLGAKLEFEVLPKADQTPPEGDLYLRAREGLVVITPQVDALARHLAGINAPPEAAVRAFWDHLIDNFVFNPVHYDQIPPDAPLDWVLESGVYDCQLAAALLVGLCRSQGINGRMVGGNFLYRRSPTNHFWAEIWLDNSGWTPFDFISWDLSRGGEDSHWRDRFFGRIEPRLITECLPGSFTGAIGVPIPPAWHMLRTIKGAGVEIQLTGLDGDCVYRDDIVRL
ncbi:MAG: transglutaminase domain-containing protein [Sphingomonadales bacterium]|nr:transglutaminase domain-containing protein [Sphingomonadales bacterium]